MQNEEMGGRANLPIAVPPRVSQFFVLHSAF
jgi:hypothetical protein